MTDTTTRRVPSMVGNPVDVFHVTETLAWIPWGATCTARGDLYRGDGILVALPEHGIVLPIPTTAKRIADWVGEVARHVTGVHSPARYFGAWQEGGTLHLDVVEAFSSAEEAEALAAARARGQRAVFHAGRQQCIRLANPEVDAELAAQYGPHAYEPSPDQDGCDYCGQGRGHALHASNNPDDFEHPVLAPDGMSWIERPA